MADMSMYLVHIGDWFDGVIDLLKDWWFIRKEEFLKNHTQVHFRSFGINIKSYRNTVRQNNDEL